MKSLILTSACLFSTFWCGPVLAIWPAPKSFEQGNQVLWIAPDVSITYNGAQLCQSSQQDSALTSQGEPAGDAQCYSGGTAAGQNSSFSSQAIVRGAIDRTKKALFDNNIVPWKLVARNELADFEPSVNAQKTWIKSVDIKQTGKDNATTFTPLAGQVDESYSITITKDGDAQISAVSSTGVLHALESFIQLFYKHSSGQGIYTNFAPISISDAPKFPHRGLNMDVSRNWYPIENILRTIDALAMNKFNRLHIHMTDAQSWPLDIPAIPELSKNGAYQVGLSYTPADFQNIQNYAIERGVETYIEFDMPGHTTSIGLTYPDLITAFNAKPWVTYCAEPPCGSLKLNSAPVYEFLEKLFDDVLPRVKPYSAYFHTGGDEVNVNSYLLDDTVMSNDTKVIGPLIQKLVDRNHDQVRKYGLTPVVWEEMALQWNLTLGKDVVVQTWLGDSSVPSVTALGHKALAGNYNFWYLDCGRGQWLNFDNGDSFKTYYPFNDYCSPNKNWRLIYSYDPLAGVPEGEQHLVLGGEVHIWSEQTDPVTIDGMLWPRASAAGEVLWSGRQDGSGQNRSQITAAPRLNEWRERMVARGLAAGPVQMVFCTQSNATECAL